jgi:hypothetical protein
VKSWLAFIGLLAVVVLGGGWLIVRLVPGPGVARAVWTSAAVAVVVQCVGFSFAWTLRKGHAMVGWGMGLGLRFLSLAIYALMVVKALGLAQAPALLSLAGFFFVTTLVEPILLKP